MYLNLEYWDKQLSREENKAEPLNILALTFAINPIDYDNSIQHLKFY